MAHDKHNDVYVTTNAPGNQRNAAQQGFWAARDAISSYVLKPDPKFPVGIMSLDDIHTDCWCLQEVQDFMEHAGSSPMLQQLYKHWVNDAISSALKSYINQKC